MEAAAERFRGDGIAASGLATIMSDAGLTNGAFYPHFKSKAELVRESVVAAMETQSQQLREALTSVGPEKVIEAYLSSEHRDNPGKGCASAALPQAKDPEGVALSVFATLIGALQLARAVEGRELSDRILTAGKDAARTLILPRPDDVAT
jgi:TetR/AcrR family transcriptional regulator, transcriptional repressor for nem operon